MCAWNCASRIPAGFESREQGIGFREQARVVLAYWRTETVTVWLYAYKLLKLSVFEAFTVIQPKKEGGGGTLQPFSVVQQGLHSAENRAARRRTTRLGGFLAIDDYCAQAGEIIGKTGRKKTSGDKGDADYFGREGLTAFGLHPCSETVCDLAVRGSEEFRGSILICPSFPEWPVI